MTTDQNDTRSERTTEFWTNTKFWTRASTTIALVVAVLLVIVFIAMLNHVVLWASYTSSQLAAAGGWVGGIGSLLAVSVALTASHFARRDAERHVKTQLLAEHRTQQIDALLMMWQTVSDLYLQADQYKNRISEFQLELIDQERLSEEEGPFDRAVRQASVASTRAVVIVDNHAVSGLVAQIVADCEVLAQSIRVANDNLGTQHHVDLLVVHEQLSTIDAHRSTLTDTIRRELPNPALTRFISEVSATQVGPPTANK
ncbi:hypothetical protein [Rhodococcoides trifolii]|uniref:hypothetical protein n=1 Tax=Rhodococcoides trifolii TaxID=908250 RepID=UPI00166AEEF4|nr:hypothetical protein [Rhodococcus trifolii]